MDHFLDHFWTTLESILESFWGPKWSQKVDPFLEGLLVAIWRHFGRLLGCLEALLGGQVFQKYGKKQYKTALFKIASLRYRNSLGWLLEAMLAHFGEVLDPKMGPQNHIKLVPKLVPCFISFWTSFGPILKSILGPKTAPEGDQKWDHFWNLPAPHLRGPTLGQIRIIRGVCKSYWNWNYTLQKKGSDSLRKPPHSVGKQRQRKGKERQRKGFVGSLLEASWDNFATS